MLFFLSAKKCQRNAYFHKDEKAPLKTFHGHEAEVNFIHFTLVQYDSKYETQGDGEGLYKILLL